MEHFLFSHILGIIIPIDFHIFQRGGPTTNQEMISVSRGKNWVKTFTAGTGYLPVKSNLAREHHHGFKRETLYNIYNVNPGLTNYGILLMDVPSK